MWIEDWSVTGDGKYYGNFRNVALHTRSNYNFYYVVSSGIPSGAGGGGGGGGGGASKLAFSQTSLFRPTQPLGMTFCVISSIENSS